MSAVASGRGVRRIYRDSLSLPSGSSRDKPDREQLAVNCGLRRYRSDGSHAQVFLCWSTSGTVQSHVVLCYDPDLAGNAVKDFPCKTLH